MADLTVSVRITGELEKNINNLHKEMMKKFKGKMIEVALAEVETPAKQKVRVDTGRLRSSIHTRYGNVKQKYKYRDDQGGSFDGELSEKPANTKTRFDVIVGTNVFYAPFIEAKWPFLAPAYLSARNIFKSELQSVIDTYRPRG